MGRLESTNNFEGFSNRILKGKITDFECKSLEKGKDVYWIISITFENSRFADKIYTVGMFERDVDGKVKANWLIDKVNKFLDFINYTGGFNIDGEFETMEGKVIQQDEIQNEIFKHMMDNSDALDCYAYKYNEYNKDDDKVYSRVWSDLAKLPDREKLQNKIQKLIDKKKLVPYVKDEQQTESKPQINGTSKVRI